ncbi:uncharacterized protein G6M90_00g003990 [Metarhizium brunneum]|uniref:Uncharacterized protein n=1 Tax=Metarhizium brunneum TaxID=500148 RepID=A0A7D5UQZ7_9HYPO|nr:hypothetical protein G6M90_00g003990 [Metarhizium brunneum]
MALDSFRQDFGLADVSVTYRDTLRGNIVSTFQASCLWVAVDFSPRRLLSAEDSSVSLKADQGLWIASQAGDQLRPKRFATGLYDIANTIGMMIFSVWLVEKVARRNGLIWGAFVGSVPMWYIGAYVMRADPTQAAAAGDMNCHGWGLLAMVCVYSYGMVYCATWQGITWVYCRKIFLIDIRMLCTAIAMADQWF